MEHRWGGRRRRGAETGRAAAPTMQGLQAPRSVDASIAFTSVSTRDWVWLSEMVTRRGREGGGRGGKFVMYSGSMIGSSRSDGGCFLP